MSGNIWTDTDPQDVDRAFDEDDRWCSDCGKPCKAVAESFDYAGTHCNHGKAGTHYTGYYVSDCCGADIIEPDETDNKQG